MRISLALISACLVCGAAAAQPNSQPRVQAITVNGGQPVLAPAAASGCAAPPTCSGSSSINCYGGLSSLADEHSTVLPPGTLPGHGDYLFFVPTKT